MNVTELSRKGSGWEGLNVGLGGALARRCAESEANSGVLWVILWIVAGGGLKQSVRSSERLGVLLSVL